MRWLLTSTLLLAAAAVPAQDNEAEQRFRKLEEKLRSAKVLKLTYRTERPKGKQGAALEGTILLAEGNKLRWEQTGQDEAGRDAGFLLIADGKSLVMAGSTARFRKPVPVRPHLREVALHVLTQQGVSLLD